MRRWLGLLFGLLPVAASAQTFPVVPGTVEIQFGASGTLVPEDQDGSWSLSPMLRIGFFLQPGVEFVAEGSTRVWPLGTKGPKGYGGGGNLLYYPSFSPTSRNLYLLAGVGGEYVDPPGPTADSEFKVGIRGGVGFKAPTGDLGLGFLDGAHLNVEFRSEYLVSDPRDLVSGGSIGLAFFR